MMGIVMGLLLYAATCSTISIINDTLPSNSHLELPEIQIKGNALVAKRRGDTLVFAADRFKRTDAIRLEQLLNNVPGFQVDTYGNISFNGRPIKKIMLDGDDLTANNYQLISRYLRSIMVDSIQVLENYHENRLLKNIQPNHEVGINLMLKKTYYSKPTIHLTPAYAPIRNGEIQAELIGLRKISKYIVISNANDIGSHALQSQLDGNQFSNNKQEPMFRSWPDVLQANVQTLLDHKYVNQNGDWVVGAFSTIKLNKHHQIRINLKKARYMFSNVSAQNQQFYKSTDTLHSLYTKNTHQRTLNETSVLLHLETDKGGQQRATYEFEAYLEQGIEKLNEARKWYVNNLLNSVSKLNTKGFRFHMNRTWKTPANRIWEWETSFAGSTNDYSIVIKVSDSSQADIFNNKLNQFNFHQGTYGQTGIGYIRTAKKYTIRYRIGTSLTQLYSIQQPSKLELLVFKNYLASHLTKPLRRKINFDMQSMLGFVQVFYNSSRKKALVYQIDQAIVWKQKATRQLSFNFGVIKQETVLDRFIAGAVYTSATNQIIGPSEFSFPIALYGQLNFSLFDLYRGINLYTQFMVREIYRDYFVATSLQPFYTSINHQVGERQSSTSFNIQIEKLIHPIRLKYRLFFNTLHMNSPTEFNAKYFIVLNKVNRVGQHMSTNWRKGYNIQFDYQYIFSTISTLSNPNIKQSRHDYKLLLQFQFSQKLNINLVVNRYSGKDLISLYLLDFKMNWFSTNKYRLFLDATNLLNKKIVAQQTLGVNSLNNAEHWLIGRRVIFGVDIPL